MTNTKNETMIELPKTQEELIKVLDECGAFKPKDLIIGELHWKYLIRSILRGKNVMIVGPARSGKTKAAKAASDALNRPFFNIPMGATQDARATLIGNTFFKKEDGTLFNCSEFIRAIKTPYAVVLLDELSRGHHDAWNILMSVLDPTQRFVRLDESEKSDVVTVAEGVTFIATANIGNEYTSTQVMDKALTLRFPTVIEMKVLDVEQEKELLKILHPNVTSDQQELLNNLVEIAIHTRLQSKEENAKVSSFIPTGTMVEMAELVKDGFSLVEIAECAIYPSYSDDGGMDSERTYIKQLVQKYVKVASKKRKSTPDINTDDDVQEVPF